MEQVIEIQPGVFDTKVKERDQINIGGNINVKVENVEYHDKKEDRPKSVVLKISAPSKHPIIRPERRNEDFYSWQVLAEHSDRISHKKVRRFFYKKSGRDIVEVGSYQLITLAFYDTAETEKLRRQGYVCTLRIVYPRTV